MPLDANKIAHIQAVIPKTFAARQKTVVFVYQNGSSYSYVAMQVIFRPQVIIDPEVPDDSGAAPRLAFDLLMVAPITTSFSGVVLIADTSIASAAAVASAQKYAVIEALPAGIVPGGTHFVVK